VQDFFYGEKKLGMRSEELGIWKKARVMENGITFVLAAWVSPYF
jgi:hypothetical protein